MRPLLEHRPDAEADRSTNCSDFFADRLKVQQREAGVRHDLIDAVFALGGEDDLVRLLARVKALQAFVETDEGANLLAGYKRAANILKKENGWDGGGRAGIPQTGEEDPLVLVEEPAIARRSPRWRRLGAPMPAEKRAGRGARRCRAQGDRGGRGRGFHRRDGRAGDRCAAPIDAFFDKVTVNDPDAAVRARRLNLLARFRDAVHQVADFSKIEG